MPTLRPYQIEDAKFLSSRKGAGLFNEQRTGKTPTALHAIELKGSKRILIVCSASMLYKWQEECLTWTKLPAVVCAGSPDKRFKILKEWTEGFLVISYGTLKNTKTINGAIDYIRKHMPDAVIVDEAHRLRGRSTAEATAVFRLRGVPFRMALTGTPVYGKQEELWSILHFLYPKTFNAYWDFIYKYFNVEMKHASRTSTFREIGEPNKLWAAHKDTILNSIACNRKRKEVMPWLPAKDKTVIRLPATQYQIRHLAELEEWYETDDLIVNTELERLLRYRMICLDPTIVGLPKQLSPKTEWIKQYIKDYPDEHILIFSQFTSYLFKLQKLLNVPIICGATPKQVRGEIVKAFQEGKYKVLLLNMPAASEGLTLDKADTTIFTDIYPPIGMIEQSEDRFVSTTPDKADKLHKIYTLLIKGTYDEEIYNLLQERKSEADIINNFKERSRANGNCNKI
jgi:SNF2 family DNA or RNA helicase